MVMPEKDKEIIEEKAAFLKDKGYSFETNEYGVYYKKGNVTISVFYEPYDDCGDISVRFWDINKFYYISWIAAANGIEPDTRKYPEIILVLLDFVRDNYESVTDPQYCERMMGKTKRMIRKTSQSKKFRAMMRRNSVKVFLHRIKCGGIK